MVWQMYASIAVLMVGVVMGQQKGTWTPEVHPGIVIQSCEATGVANISQSNPARLVASSCKSESASLVLDANWRWIHKNNDYTNCISGDSWDSSICPDPVTCAKNCALEGADYANSYGITTSGATASLKFKVNSNVGSRVYLLESPSKYKIFKLKNREFSMDVDVSSLPCGLNGAVYFVEMPADGGTSAYPTNQAGATYGTGYCDAQCPRDVKFINGEANNKDGPYFGKGGHYGACCVEMDIWEANTMATAYTNHICSTPGGLTRCEGRACDSACDRAGCDYNPYRTGSQFFYGPGMGYQIDSTKSFTVVTQFITKDNTDLAPLAEIKRFYVQNGKIFENPSLQFGTTGSLNSLSDSYCSAEASLFHTTDVQKSMGGLAAMGAALDRGMVLTMSLWDDYSTNMLWLDSEFPTDANPSQPGIARGACPTSSGKPSDVESQYGSSTVKYMNIRYGAIGSTFTA